MSEIKQQLIEIVDHLESKDLKESQISEYLDDLVDLLAEDEDETISVLSQLNENQVTWLLPTFEELAFTFQSRQFIEAIERYTEAYPDIPNIEEYIANAKEAIDE